MILNLPSPSSNPTAKMRTRQWWVSSERLGYLQLIGKTSITEHAPYKLLNFKKESKSKQQDTRQTTWPTAPRHSRRPGCVLRIVRVTGLWHPCPPSLALPTKAVPKPSLHLSSHVCPTSSRVLPLLGSGSHLSSLQDPVFTQLSAHFFLICVFFSPIPLSLFIATFSSFFHFILFSSSLLSPSPSFSTRSFCIT